MELKVPPEMLRLSEGNFPVKKDQNPETTAIVEAQQALGVAFCERDESLGNINKRQFYAAAQAEYGDSEHWEVDTWLQIIDDLKNLADWVKTLERPF